MTKKYFIQAAEIISNISNKKERKVVANHFANFFAQTNDRFKRDTFLEACEPKDVNYGFM